MSARLKITAKGQLTLRRGVLEHLGAQAGQHVVADLLPDGRVELRAERAPSGLAALRGILRRPGQPTLSVEEIGQATGQGAVEAYERSVSHASPGG